MSFAVPVLPAHLRPLTVWVYSTAFLSYYLSAFMVNESLRPLILNDGLPKTGPFIHVNFIGDIN